MDAGDDEDIQDLEARLYGQIHHDADEANITSIELQQGQQGAIESSPPTDNKSFKNMPLNEIGKRYWNAGNKNDFNRSRSEGAFQPMYKKELQNDSIVKSTQNIHTNENTSFTQNPEKSKQTKTTSKPNLVKVTTIKPNPRKSFIQSDTKMNEPQTSSEELQKANPSKLASNNNRFGNAKGHVKKAQFTKHSHNATARSSFNKGPFGQKEQKLQKFIQIANKKQKAKKSRERKTSNTTEIIQLLSSDSDDVVEVPLPVVPIYDIVDSDEEEERNKEARNVLPIEENALDATDVKGMSEAFVKPHEKQHFGIVNSSCPSPCSVVSYDDFIGQNDRKRLLDNNIIVDDEYLLSTDSNSAMAQNPNAMAVAWAAIEDSSNDLEFLTPSIKGKITGNYRVEQEQFRAVDVYESESDINDTIQKAVKVDVAVARNENSGVNHRTKRLRRRRSSGGNKDGQTHNDMNNSSDTDEDMNQSSATGVAFISRGPAVEHCKSNNPLRRSLSDSKFIAALNSLAQGNGSGGEIEEVEEHTTEDSDTHNTPTAREMAESVLEKQHQTNADNGSSCVYVSSEGGRDSPESVILMSVAQPALSALDNPLPGDALEGLEYIFKKIDEMGNPAPPKESYESSSDSDIEEIMPVDPNQAYIINTTLVQSVGWNEEMRRFYNNSWNGEKFNLNDVWQKMNRKKSLWKINYEDRVLKNRRISYLKCYNCCELGHIRSKCTQPKKPLRCYMCGSIGHLEPRCPNTICLRCGTKTQVFTKRCNACSFQDKLVCPLCGLRGHNVNFCPDKWRRYHSTIEPNQVPSSALKYNKKKCCYRCGGVGHLAESCRTGSRFLEYPTVTGQIKSHQKSYEDFPVKRSQFGIPVKLLYNPSLQYDLNLARNCKTNDCYERFLRAVNLLYLRRKRRNYLPTSSRYIENQPYSNSRKRTRRSLQEVADKHDQESNEVQKISNNIRLEEISDEPRSVIVTELKYGSNESTDAPVITDNNSNDVTIMTNDGQTENTVNSESATINGATSTGNQLNTYNIDSDSNYSFSEHFEMPAETTKTTVTQDQMSAVTAEERLNRSPMGPLPDFIPLNNGDKEDNSDIKVENTGKYIAADSNDDDSNCGTRSALPEEPSEARIYLSNPQSNFLLSSDGTKFLKQKSDSYNITLRMNVSTAGNVLVIHGLVGDQETFHRELLLKYEEFTVLENNKRKEQFRLPKRTDVFIRSLRYDITQLNKYLGNVHDVFNRMCQAEKQNSKNGKKLADKLRRTLNMMLFGQAGLREGGMHLDMLVGILKKLLNGSGCDPFVPADLRAEADKHWKAIFTSHCHDNYEELVKSYAELASNNNLPKFNVDPVLLGLRMLNTSFKANEKEYLKSTNARVVEQRDSNNKCQGNIEVAKISGPSTFGNSNAAVLNSPPTCSNKVLRNAHMSTAVKSLEFQKASGSIANSLQKQNTSTSKSISAMAKEQPNNNTQGKAILMQAWESACKNLVSKTNNPEPFHKGIADDHTQPSTFWSHESKDFLNQCLEKLNPTTKNDAVEKLERLLQKSREGSLSQNDYCSITEFYRGLFGDVKE